MNHLALLVLSTTRKGREDLLDSVPLDVDGGSVDCFQFGDAEAFMTESQPKNLKFD